MVARGHQAGERGRAGDDTLPDLQIDDARVRLRLVPVADSAGRLTYPVQSAPELTGSVQATGVCDVLGFDACELAVGYRSHIVQRIEDGLATVVGSTSAKASVGNAMKPVLRQGWHLQAEGRAHRGQRHRAGLVTRNG